MKYRSRELVGANVCTLFNTHTYLAMGTLIRIRNVCFCYIGKVELYSFSRILNGKKWCYMIFFGNYLKKIGSYVVFPGVILKKWRYVVIPGKC